MSLNAAYQAGLLDEIGDWLLGPRESLADLLLAADEVNLSLAYNEGRAMGRKLLAAELE